MKLFNNIKSPREILRTILKPSPITEDSRKAKKNGIIVLASYDSGRGAQIYGVIFALISAMQRLLIRALPQFYCKLLIYF